MDATIAAPTQPLTRQIRRPAWALQPCRALKAPAPTFVKKWKPTDLVEPPAVSKLSVDRKVAEGLNLLYVLMKQHYELLSVDERYSMKLALVDLDRADKPTNQALNEIEYWLGRVTAVRTDNARKVLAKLMRDMVKRFGEDGWKNHTMRKRANFWAKGPKGFKNIAAFFAEADYIAGQLEYALAPKCAKCHKAAVKFAGRICDVCENALIEDEIQNLKAMLAKMRQSMPASAVPDWNRARSGLAAGALLYERFMANERRGLTPAEFLKAGQNVQSRLRNTIKHYEWLERRPKGGFRRPEEDRQLVGRNEGDLEDLAEINEEPVSVVAKTEESKPGAKARKRAQKAEKQRKLNERRPYEREEKKWK